MNEMNEEFITFKDIHNKLKKSSLKKLKQVLDYFEVETDTTDRDKIIRLIVNEIDKFNDPFLFDENYSDLIQISNRNIMNLLK